MPSWPIGGWRSLTISDQFNLPPVRKEHLQQYVLYRQVCDQQASQDVRAVARGEKMVAGEAVQAISYTEERDIFYFTGIVDAEMKTTTSYNLKLILSSQGEVQNTQCECPVGQGIHATCKHVTAVLLVLIDLRGQGELHIQKSCTETLQGFQKPRKKHAGSPVKVEGLGAGLEGRTSNWDMDPRKPQYKNRPSYQEEVQNLTTNFVAFSGLDLSMSTPRLTSKKLLLTMTTSRNLSQKNR